MKKLSQALNKAVSAENLEDIIFEGRNHEYGAYALRRNYNTRVNLSLLAVISIASLIALFSFFRAIKTPPEIVPFGNGGTVIEVIKPEIEKLLQPPPEYDPSAIKHMIDKTMLIDPVIVDKEVTDFDVPIVDDYSDLLKNNNPNPFLDNIKIVYTEGTSVDGIETTDPTYDLTQVEEQAMFMGGTVEDFRNWLLAHMQYPLEAAQNGLEGTVFVKFTVGKNGKIRDVIVQRKVHPILDQAAVDAILKSPDKWKAARRNGYDVNVSYTIPIKYSLQN